MSLITKAELEVLAAEYDGPCVSILMPTHRRGPEVLQGPIRLRNLVEVAEGKLVARGMRAPEARDLLEPARDLAQVDSFWQHQSDGLALFIHRDFARYYRLPITFEEMAVVGERFHAKPLLSVLSADERFFILALSQDEVRLLQGTRFSVASVVLGDDVPRSLSEALHLDDPETTLQWHMGHRAGPRTPHEAMCHGHGFLSADDAKDRILRYLQKLDVGVRDLLADQESPIVLAAVDYLLPLYREANSLPWLLEEGIEGNPETLSPQELHERAWRIVEPIFSARRAEAADAFDRLAGRGDKRASEDVREAVIRSYEGRTDTLFVATDLERWGRYDPKARRVELHEGEGEGGYDLLNLAAMHTLLGGGRVFAVESAHVPGSGPLAAIFRY